MTIAQFFLFNLPGEIAKRAILNTRRRYSLDFLKKDISTMDSPDLILRGAFGWAKSPEGARYWVAVNDEREEWI